MNKLEKLRQKYKGIEFKQCPFAKTKYTWKWDDMSGHCIKYKDLEFSIAYNIDIKKRLKDIKVSKL